MTLPNGNVPHKDAGVNHGNGRLWVSLWQNGTVLAEPGNVHPDGSIDAKFGWWRGVKGQLSITGRRLDGFAPRLRAYIPGGYGSRGFQSTQITFPTQGCWKVTGRVEGTKLIFITLVLKSS